MNTKWMQIAAVASALGLCGSAMAADAGHTVGQMQSGSSQTRGTPEGNTVSGSNAVGGSERVDNTSPAGFDAWMNDYATTHNGRITRQEFMDQMNHRWDTLDAQHRGYMTPGEARNIYAPDQAVKPARSGSDVTPGYTGPGSSKAQ